MNKTYITNIQHYLDEKGNIPENLPKKAKNLAYFFVLLIDQTTEKFKRFNQEINPNLRCFSHRCKGSIVSALYGDQKIHWECNTCGNSGIISDWEDTDCNNIRP